MSSWPIADEVLRALSGETSQLNCAMQVSLTNGDADYQSSNRWSWSPVFVIPNEAARHHLSLFDRQFGCERLVSFVVLRHRSVSHLIFFKDPQPPQLLINQTPFALHFQQMALVSVPDPAWLATQTSSAANGSTSSSFNISMVQVMKKASAVHWVEPGQMSELVLPDTRQRRVRQPSAAADDDKSNPSKQEQKPESEPQASADSSTSDQTQQQETDEEELDGDEPEFPGWDQEEQIFAQPRQPRWLRYRLAAPVCARVHDPSTDETSKSLTSAWSSPVQVKPNMLHATRVRVGAHLQNLHHSEDQQQQTLLVEVVERRGCTVIVVSCPQFAIPRLLLPPLYSV
jgi:hypothetical protein